MRGGNGVGRSVVCAINCDGGCGCTRGSGVAIEGGDIENTIAASCWIIGGVAVTESVEESFCLCGGEFRIGIAGEGDGGGAGGDGYGEVVVNGAQSECACVTVG